VGHDFLNVGLSPAEYIKDFYWFLVGCVYTRQYFKSLKNSFCYSVVVLRNVSPVKYDLYCDQIKGKKNLSAGREIQISFWEHATSP
jgi:hypothetical protein